MFNIGVQRDELGATVFATNLEFTEKNYPTTFYSFQSIINSDYAPDCEIFTFFCIMM